MGVDVYESGHHIQAAHVNILKVRCLDHPFLDTCDHPVFYQDGAGAKITVRSDDFAAG